MNAPSSTSLAGPDTALRTARLIALCVFTGALTFGMLLPVLALHVHQRLHFGPVIVGVVIGMQFVATVLTRGMAGRRADQRGARRTVLQGLLSCTLAGGLYAASVLLPLSAGAQLGLLLGGRILSGLGESQLVTGALAWGIGTVGAPNAGRVLAWTGMALYGALAIGAPCGMLLARVGGFGLVAGVTIALPIPAVALALRLGPVAPHGGRRATLTQVLRIIAWPGCALALQGVGFAAIGTFVTLHFAAHGWPDAGFALSGFGAAFVLMRVLFAGLPDHMDGYTIALGALGVELAGQLLLWHAAGPAAALAGAAISGLGCSLVYPALGAATLKHVPPQSRGTALGGFTAFQDVAYGATGPLAGLLVPSFGYHAAFAAGAAAAALGIVVTIVLKVRAAGTLHRARG
ncbi:arabinose transporter [Paraburkholderia ferrariae]|uniref:arabinose transporter n=1 Tax=Paraburkholderia ferrariae TaxID=386056 RepID=UPI0004847BE1|nr:arabinose transporter [Paraburkholderia ferrariae]